MSICVENGTNWIRVGRVEDVGTIITDLDNDTLLDEFVHTLAPMTEYDRLAYLKDISKDTDELELTEGEIAFLHYGVDPITEGDPREATHWAIIISVPDELSTFSEEERRDITWWDMSVYSCKIVDGVIYAYSPEFGYSWWQATYRERQVYAVCDALAILAVDGRMVDEMDDTWDRVYSDNERQ